MAGLRCWWTDTKSASNGSTRRLTKSKLAVYVNGTFRGKWLVEDCEERRRFCYCVKHSLIKKNCPENKKKWFLKAMGKNEEDYAYYTYSPYYPSFAALRRQLVKNNQDIQLITEE